MSGPCHSAPLSPHPAGSDKLEWYLAGWMHLKALLVRHALGFSCDGLGFTSDAFSSPSQSNLCTRQRSGRGVSFPGAANVMKKS